MKIIKVDSFNREGPGHDDVLIAQGLDSFWGNRIVSLLNEWSIKRDPNTEDFFKLVVNNRKLYGFKP